MHTAHPAPLAEHAARQQSNPRVQRPWGWYETASEASFGATGMLIKRIGVNPGAQISLQKHAQRAEHWVVVRGTAVVTLGQANGSLEETTLHVGQHCNIALGQIHRLANRSREPMEIVEVQLGSYLGEDDVTRFADDFGRK